MHINNIRPFDEKASDSSPDTDSRTTAFMDAIRTRVADGDEKQRQRWVKSIKPTAVRKPLTPARPAWLNAPKAAQGTPKSTKMLRSRPFGSPKRKPPQSDTSGEG